MRTVDARSPIASDVHGPYAPGQLLLGKYRVDQVIGQGGMGLVLGATHVELQHRVAIKVLLPGEVAGEVIEARFLREAQVAAGLRSENVVRVFDVGRLEDGRPYMVMEWLDGRDLSTGPMGTALPSEEAVDYLVQACDAMAAAHARNLVHRDLKPANLFLVNDEHGVPTVKVLDFGISKVRHAEGSNMALTEANGLMGSPLYMSPEQVRSARDVDARADIWSLGTILYELLTGVPPFAGETLGAVFLAVAQDTPRPISELRPELPLQLATIIEHCLEKDPELRFQRVQELQQALLPFALPRSQAKMAMRSSSAAPPLGGALSVAPAAAQALSSARTTGGWTEPAKREQLVRRRLGGAAAVAVLVGLAFGALWWRASSVVNVPEQGAVNQATAIATVAVVSAPSSLVSSQIGEDLSVSPVASAASEPTRSRRALSKQGAVAGPRDPAPMATRGSTVQSSPTPVATSVLPKSTAAAKKNPLEIQFK